MLTAGATVIDDYSHTLIGTVLDQWVRSLCPDGRTVPRCEHVTFGMPAVLSTDDPDPRIRCGRCAQAAVVEFVDDSVCHLCGQESPIFTEFVTAARGQLVITGNACPACLADIRRGRPALRER
jgi:hypothetical protein